MRRIVVLGAGVTGLAAADRLLELGVGRVTVVEAEPVVGGLAATIEGEGVATDLGPHRLHTELSEIQSFLPEVIGDRLFRVRRSSRMYLAGRWVAYPLRLGQAARSLGLGQVLRLGAGLATAKLRAALPRRSPATFAGAMQRAFGGPAYRSVFEPYARKVWRTEPSDLSAEIARVRLPARGVGAVFGRLLRGGRGPAGPLREFQYVRGGIGRLSEALAGRIARRGGQIRLQTKAVGLNFGSTGVCGVNVQGPNGAALLDADALISTIPLPALGAMAPGGDLDLRAALANLEYLSIILVVLIVGRERIGPDHWLYFPQEPPLPTRASEPKNFDASLAPPDRTCLCCEITCRRSEALWESRDDEIAGRVEREMIDVGLIRAGDVLSRFVVRKDWGYPIYALGFERQLEIIWPFLARFPNLLTVGRQGLFNHNNIDHCLVMGRRAAETAVADREPSRRWYASLDRFADFRIYD